MILIGESGATKASWSFHNESGVKQFETSGIRCGVTSDAAIESILNNVRNHIDLSNYQGKIHFYCSGCFAQDKQAVMHNLFQRVFPDCKEIYVKSDLHAAGLSALGSKNGFCIILGTGSVGFRWKNNEVNEVFGGKGFPGGDFLGGADLGRRLLNLFKSNNKHTLLNEFEAEFGNINSIEKRITPEATPAFFGQFAPFVIANKDNCDLSKIIQDACNDFFIEMPDITNERYIGIVGSIGTVLKTEIYTFLKRLHHQKLIFVQHPIDHLTEIHVTRLKSN